MNHNNCILCVTKYFLAKLQERGNKLFGDGDHAEAKLHYVAAIFECPDFFDLLRESSFVLSNKAAAWLGKLRGTEQISAEKARECSDYPIV